MPSMINSLLKINRQSSLLEPVTYLASPHCDERPENMLIDLLVIHGISLPPNEFGTGDVEQFFCGKLDNSLHPYYQTIAHLRVSAHLLIKRNGEIIQFVPFAKRAWHAGESYFQGKTRCNDFSIGIELEGADHISYEKIQYEQLGRVSRLLMQTYSAITHDRIVGHVDIASGRKTDPGPAFDWAYLKGMLT